MSDVLEFLRAVNAVLALLTFGGLCYRLPQAWKSVTSRSLFIALALFPPLAGVGSGRAFALHLPSSPLTPVFTVCYVFLGFVLIRWPARLTGSR